MLLSQAIDDFLDASWANGCSKRTIQVYRGHLQHLMRFLGDVNVEDVTNANLNKYVGDLRNRASRYSDHPYKKAEAGGLSPASVASYMRPMARLFNWLAEQRLITKNPAEGIRRHKVPRREPKAISMDDWRKLLSVTQGDDPMQRRDFALLQMLMMTGCRVGGLAHLELKDLDLVGLRAAVTEKGSKRRTVFFDEPTRDAIERWLDARPKDKGDWLFVNLGPTGRDARLTEDAMGEVLRRLKKRAGVKGHVHPHSFRHAFAREWKKKGLGDGALSQMLGHADPAFTARTYGMLQVDDLQEVYRRFSPVTHALGDEEELGE